MIRRAVLLCLLVACKHAPAVADDAGADASISDASVVVEIAPEADAAPPSSLAALLSGGGARNLPEQATDPDAGFDNGLRVRMTTREVEEAPSSADAGIAPVKGEATIGAFTATVPIADAARVLAGMRARMRMCYQTGLNSDRDMRGKLTLTAKLLPNGEVGDVEVTTNTGLSPGVAHCASVVLRRAQFDAPGMSGSTLTVPITFAPAK